MNRVGTRGKLNWFTRKDIKAIDPSFDLINLNELELHNILEEFLLENNFVLFDNDIDFIREIIVNGWHERRYNCMVLRGKRIKGRFVLKECGIQYHYII